MPFIILDLNSNYYKYLIFIILNILIIIKIKINKDEYKN